ncbi:MAG: metal ABC transporter solute-binding protein, Zn/Mn family, partial [Thiomonas sp.]
MPYIARRVFSIALLIGALFGTPIAHAQAAPRVAVSIKPVGDLVAAVMAGVGTPTVLIPPGSSPHTYAFKPSERAAAEQAQLLFWIGPDVEPALTKITRALPAGTRVITLSTLPGMHLLPARSGGEWERKHPAPLLQSATQDAHDPAHTGSFDGHLWLSPTNAKEIVRSAAGALEAMDPQHAAQY